jgi:hypothetical protein
MTMDDSVKRWTALVIDCHTRELLGWHLSRSGKATTASAALEHGLIARFGTLGRVDRKFLLRSDNGLAFTSRHFTTLVRSYGLRQEFITPHSPWASDQWRHHGSSRSKMAWSSARSARSRSNAFTATASKASSTPHRLSVPGSASTITAAHTRRLPCARPLRHSD